MRSRQLFFAILIFILASPSTATELAVRPYSFDAGPPGGSIDRFSTALTPADIYTTERGFGWTSTAGVPFTRPKERSGTLRDDMTSDGIAAGTLGFRINLPPGEWWFTCWLDVGYEDSATTQLSINGEPYPVVWHHLKPDEEGRTSLSGVYRVIHLPCTLRAPGLSFALRGVRDSVRFLGCTFIPARPDSSPETWKFGRLLAETGRYKSAVSCDAFARRLHNELLDDPTDSRLFYWRQQLSFLAEAERLQQMEGWEWATQLTGVSIFERMHQALMLLDANIENFPHEGNPLLERARWLRGKICYDLVLERGGDYQDRVGRADLAWLFRRYPDDRPLAMLNGVLVESPDPSDYLPLPGNPPRWAVLQREAIHRLKTEIDWWVHKRQSANGELGGKIDDDVEILRTWIPMLLFGDEATILGWKRLADAVWVNPRVYKGFSKLVRDVEHSAEFISDSTPELLLVDEDSTYLRRLTFTADYFEHLWSARNAFGRRFFKSSWLGATGIDERPPRNRDVEMNSRALKPLRYLAWATRDDRYVRLTDEWAQAWVSAALRTDKGKPAGIVPASMRAYDEALNGDEPTWYEPNMLWDYYAWSERCGTAILDHLIFTYDLTGDDSLLLPVELTLRLVHKQLEARKDLTRGSFEAGSESWVAQHLIRNPAFWSTVQNWRIRSGKNSFDSLIARNSTPYVRYRLTGAERALEEGFDQLLQTLRHNTPLRTDMVVHTDRVRIPGIDHLKAMIAGDGTPEGNSPYFAVSWRETNEHLAMLVRNSTDSLLSVSVFNFNPQKKSIVMRPWRLAPGRYLLELNTAAGKTAASVVISRPGEHVRVALEPEELTEVLLRRIP
ncbi:MAG: hypothetical protein IT282_04990 [Bacteroidetes bacterium]|nr:hypothetical protein [Bacteroidota bacterium]